jgi:hypothetical protein
VTTAMGASTTGYFSAHVIDTSCASAMCWMASMMAWSVSSQRGQRPRR